MTETENWIDKNIKETDTFYYILSKDIPANNKKSIVDYLTTNGWEYRTVLSRSITKRGYKKMKFVRFSNELDN